MPIQRRRTTQVNVGSVVIGSEHPIVVQAMTNTPTADVDKTIRQIKELVTAGSELVRLTIADDAGAKAVPAIHQNLSNQGIDVPLIGDFHFNGHQLLNDHPDMANVLSKYRVNPGNVGRGNKHDKHFEAIIKAAVTHQKPVRIGVNGGSLNPELLSEIMKENAKSRNPKMADDIFCQAVVESALQSAQQALNYGLKENQIILSAKTSDVQDLITVYQELAKRSPFPLHVGLTEAGGAEQGIVQSSVGIGVILQQGIGDTIRVSLTPDEDTPRWKEVAVCRHILQSVGIRHFQPRVISCPGCGRTCSDDFQKLAQRVNRHIQEHIPEWSKHHPGAKQMTIAVMGCVVNGPGESRHADIGISLPGQSEDPAAPVYIHGKLFKTLRGKALDQQFLDVLDEFVKKTL